MVQIKTKLIGFRVEKSLYDFLHDWSRKKNIKMTDLVRNLCIFMQIGCSLNNGNMSIDSVFSNEKSKQSFKTFINSINC
jgi:hypothetical protein